MTTTLLAVDDSKTMRKVLEITFAGEDYRTVLAESSAVALERLRGEKPAIALVDAQLGGESGYDLCQSIKRESPGVPVIILSSKQQPYDRARGSSVGADDFMDKPFDTQQLIDKVAMVIRKAAEVPVAAPVVQPPAAAPPAAARPQERRAPTLTFGTPAPTGPSAVQAQRPPSTRLPAPAIRPQAPAAPMRPRAPTPVSGTPAQQAPARPPSSPPARPPSARPPAPAARPAPAAAPVAAVPAAAAAVGGLAEKLQALGLTEDQIKGVLALSREVVEQVVWEVVPVLAETLIQEEIKRLTSE